MLSVISAPSGDIPPQSASFLIDSCADGEFACAKYAGMPAAQGHAGRCAHLGREGAAARGRRLTRGQVSLITEPIRICRNDGACSLLWPLPGLGWAMRPLMIAARPAGRRRFCR